MKRGDEEEGLTKSKETKFTKKENKKQNFKTEMKETTKIRKEKKERPREQNDQETERRKICVGGFPLVPPLSTFFFLLFDS